MGLDRVDGKNIAPAATQTATASFVATHNQKATLLITGGGANYTSGGDNIQAGVVDGQTLTIIMVDDADRTTIATGGKALLSGDWNTGDLFGVGMWLKLIWDATNSKWIEVGRGVRENTNAGKGAHAEGQSHSISATATHGHAEGFNNTVSAQYAHAQGDTCTASGDDSDAMGEDGVADQSHEHAHGGSKFTSVGDAQYMRFICRAAITPAIGGDVIGIDAGANGPVIPADTTWSFRAEVVGQSADAGAVSSATIVGVIKSAGTTVSAPSAATVTVIHADDSDIVFTAVANNTAKTLDITVTDTTDGAVPYRFVVTIHMTQITFT